MGESLAEDTAGARFRVGVRELTVDWIKFSSTTADDILGNANMDDLFRSASSSSPTFLQIIFYVARAAVAKAWVISSFERRMIVVLTWSSGTGHSGLGQLMTMPCSSRFFTN